MYRRIPIYELDERNLIPVDHSRLSDSDFARLRYTKFYREYDASCATCAAHFRFTAKAQKRLCEKPTALYEYAPFHCKECRPLVAQLNRLRRRKVYLEKTANADLAHGPTPSPLERARAKLELIEQFGTGSPHKLLAIAREAIVAEPGSVEANTLLARAHRLLDQDAAATAVLAKFCDVYPHHDLEVLLSAATSPSETTAAVQMRLLTRDLEERKSAARRPDDISWELFFPCDLDIPAVCPHCAIETHHPFLIYGNSVNCPHCDRSFNLPDCGAQRASRNL
jgi:hypothetical protein